MKLVVLSEYARFVALSYMWEDGAENSNTQLQKNNLAMLEVSGGISKISLPNRISDAISLCRDLGEDYLWVDRLCIIQDDALSKHGQICAMDKIYSSAAFTIIIALDQRDRGGIPGVNRRPRYSSTVRPLHRCADETRGIIPMGMGKVILPFGTREDGHFKNACCPRDGYSLPNSKLYMNVPMDKHTKNSPIIPRLGEPKIVFADFVPCGKTAKQLRNEITKNTADSLDSFIKNLQQELIATQETFQASQNTVLWSQIIANVNCHSSQTFSMHSWVLQTL